MRTHLWMASRPVIRFLLLGLLAALVGAAVVVCGGGANGGIEPPTLEGNPSTPWEVMTAGDNTQCLLRPPRDKAAEKTAKLVERQLADAGSNANVIMLGDNAYLLGVSRDYTDCYAKTWAGFWIKPSPFRATTMMRTGKAITLIALAPKPARMAKAQAITASTKVAGRCLRSTATLTPRPAPGGAAQAGTHPCATLHHCCVAPRALQLRP